MFQPQATPYSPFSVYGAAASLQDFAGFSQSSGGVVDSGGPSRIYSPVAINPPLQATLNVDLDYNNHSGAPQTYRRMSGHDMEAQEALARDFQPALEGALVGEKKSSLAITEEYAKADPVYVAKTVDLPHRYSHFRKVLGDGNCGWRAIGFSYFETLLRLRDRSQVEGEVARMISLNNFLENVGGFESWLFEDMVKETLDLLKDLADLVETSPQGAEDLLQERFNDPDVSNPIVYHLRMLASSWLKGNASTYQDFIPDGVESYTKNCIEPVNQEIDNMGMTLLIDVLLKPIGFSVEIVYLDRSQGTQANSHVFQALDDNGIPTNPGGPMIYLLYRPSHYDILYKEQRPSISLEQVPVHTDIQINRATNFSQHHTVSGTPAMGEFSQMDMSLLACIPGFSLGGQPSHHGFPSQFTSHMDHYPPSPMSSSISPISPGASSASTSSNNPIAAPFPTQPPPPSSLSPPAATFPNPSTQLPILTHMPAAPQRPSLSSHPSHSSHPSLSALSSDLASPSSATSFRPSKYEWEAAADWQDGAVGFQTSMFKNSHYNTAHYNNQNFQPEQWSPECEEMPGRKKSA